MCSDIIRIKLREFLLEIMHNPFCCASCIGKDKRCLVLLNQAVDKLIHLMVHYAVLCINKINNRAENF